MGIFKVSQQEKKLHPLDVWTISTCVLYLAFSCSATGSEYALSVSGINKMLSVVLLEKKEEREKNRMALCGEGQSILEHVFTV